MRKLQSIRLDGLWLVTSAAILWGTIGVATQAIFNVDSTTSLFINLTRMLIATPVLLIGCWRVVGKTMFRIQRRDLLIMLLSGTLLAISQAAYFAAIRYAGVTIATLLTICIAPLVVTCITLMLKLETLTRQIVIALICAVIGSAMLVGLNSLEGVRSNLALGTVFSLVAAASYAGVIICGRYLAADYHPLQVTSVTFSVGSIVLLAINLFSGVVAVHTIQGWLLVLYLGLVPTAFAYWLLQMGLRSVSATTASIVSMVDPFVAALLAWGLLGETLTVTGIAGTALLILSLFLLTLEKRKGSMQPQ
jgi:DME family drug/metabolite transporter